MENKINLLSNEEYEFEKANKIIDDMSLREYNAFLVNNKELLIEMMNKINAKEIADIEYTEIKKEQWGIPQEQYYNQHKRIPSRRTMNKNISKDYGNNILIKPNRSHTEIVFEYWCESNVKWVYKNGEKGNDFFTIIYHIAFRRYNFYPDYIIGTNDGKIWIIEAKGGVDSTGESKNNDKVVKNKFEALKKYAEKENINWGFVRAIDQQLYISNTEWTENMFNNNIWKPFEEIIK